jgi:hypothetical protein
MPVNSKPSSRGRRATALFPITDRRSSPRFRTVCFDVKLDRGGTVGLFRARNISDAGMMLDTHVALGVGEPVLVNLSDRVAIHGTITWCDERRCGVQFAQAIDCAAMLQAEARHKREDRRGGALRLAAMRRATSYAENGSRAVKVVNVSHRGMGLRHDGTLAAGMLLNLVVAGGVERRAAVRWSKDGGAGVRLMEPLSCEEIERVSNNYHPAVQAPVRAPAWLLADYLPED